MLAFFVLFRLNRTIYSNTLAANWPEGEKYIYQFELFLATIMFYLWGS